MPDSSFDLEIDLQIACEDEEPPSQEQLGQWIETTLNQARYSPDSNQGPVELTVRIVTNDESQHLNNTYRNKDKPTNVLSFPFEAPEGIPLTLLGDLIVAAEVVRQEAIEQGKPLTAHWAHMIVHGTLHLLGYDHTDAAEADIMEQLETQILKSLGFNDPYNPTTHHERFSKQPS